MRWRAAIACALCVLAAPALAEPSVAASTGVQLFVEPAASERLYVVSPSVHATATLPFIEVEAGWSADVVTGATARTYGSGTDVVTSATHMSDTRNQALLGVRVPLHKIPLTLEVGYRYSTESDYHSNMIRLGATLALRPIDAQLTVRWAHDFDRVCDLDNGTLLPLQRQPLGTSTGCFVGGHGLVQKSLDIDGVELVYQQVLTARVRVGINGFYAHLAGFQSNPYRRVALDQGQIFAQESHPAVRDRGSLGLSLRWAPGTETRGALGADLHLYADTWAIRSLALELAWDEQQRADRLRWRIHARYYQQSAAFFYRDAGWRESYERAGPVGQYFTGDRQNAPLADLTVGASLHGQLFVRERRVVRFLRRVDLSVALDAIKVFALSPDPPNRARTQGVVDALVATATIEGEL